MMEKRYNEFKVTFATEPITDSAGVKIGMKTKTNRYGVPVIDKKELTERGHVMISERDCVTNNLQTRFNKLHYELAEDIKSPERIALETEAIALGVKFRNNIGDANLLEKINEAKK